MSVKSLQGHYLAKFECLAVGLQFYIHIIDISTSDKNLRLRS